MSGIWCNIDMMQNNDCLTNLRGNLLSEKDSPIIILRGKIDSLCAMLLEAQLLGERAGNQSFVDDLQEILEFARSIFTAEYREAPMGEFRLLGLDAGDLRERCRHPEKHFGHGHLLMDKSMGELSLRLNLLRTFTSEVEISAVTAFRGQRPDIIGALNGLSSLFYVMTYKYLPGDYCLRGNPGVTFTGSEQEGRVCTQF